MISFVVVSSFVVFLLFVLYFRCFVCFCCWEAAATPTCKSKSIGQKYVFAKFCSKSLTTHHFEGFGELGLS